MSGVKITFDEVYPFKGWAIPVTYRIHVTYQSANSWWIDEIEVVRQSDGNFDRLPRSDDLWMKLNEFSTRDDQFTDIERAINTAMADDYDENQYEGVAA